MPSGENLASCKFAITSLNSYAGQIRVSCAYAGAEMGAKVPSCGIYTNPTFNLAANQTVAETLTLMPYGKVIPLRLLCDHRMRRLLRWWDCLGSDIGSVCLRKKVRVWSLGS